MQVLAVFIVTGFCGGFAAEDVSQLPDSGNILRPNYGLAFEKIGKVVTSSSYWYHTFVVALPDPDTLLPTGNTYIHGVVGDYLRELQLAIYTKALNIIDYAKRRLSPLPSTRTTRTRILAPSGTIGSLSSSPFNTATDDDVEKISHMVHRLSKCNIVLSKELQSSTANLESYMKTSNKRMDTLKKEVSINHRQIEILETQSSSLTRTFKKRMEWQMNITLQLMSQLKKVTEIGEQLQSLGQAIFKLARGILPDVLVNEKTLSDTFQQLSDMKETAGNKFEFIHTDPSHYYQDASFIAHFNATDIWITLKLPIGLHKPMHLYRVHSWTLPIHKGSDYGTIVEGLPDFLATDDRQTKYTAISGPDLSRCHGYSILTCPFSQPITDVHSGRCLDSLMRNNALSIHVNCEVTALPSTITSKLYPVTHDLLLIQKLNSITMICGNQARVIEGCDTCLLHVPCNCIIQSGDFRFVSPSNKVCMAGLKEIKRHFLLNLAVLNTFTFNIVKELDFLPNSVFTKEHNITRQRFKQLDAYFTKRDDQLSRTLKNIATRQTDIVNDINATVKQVLQDKTVTLLTLGSIVSSQPIIPIISLLLFLAMIITIAVNIRMTIANTAYRKERQWLEFYHANN